MRAPAAFLTLLSLCACTAPPPPAAPPPRDAGYAADFDQFWSEIAESYCYFDEKKTDWDAVRTRARPRASALAGRAELITLLEATMDELYDAHASLRTNTPHSFRLVPSGTDLWAELIDGKATVTEVRPQSPAARAGLRAGQEIIAIGGVPVERAIEARMGASLRGPDVAARDFALRSLLAGRHDEPRRISLRALYGAVHEGKLARSGIGFAYPGERLFHINGTPRERWLPPVGVDLLGQDDPGRDPILERAIALIHPR